jgi:hypothetical protein
METIYHGNNVKPTGKYNNKSGKVVTYTDHTVVTIETKRIGELLRQAQAGVKAGKISQRASVVQYNFARLLEQDCKCDDYGRNG